MKDTNFMLYKGSSHHFNKELSMFGAKFGLILKFKNNLKIVPLLLHFHEIYIIPLFKPLPFSYLSVNTAMFRTTLQCIVFNYF